MFKSCRQQQLRRRRNESRVTRRWRGEWKARQSHRIVDGIAVGIVVARLLQGPSGTVGSRDPWPSITGRERPARIADVQNDERADHRRHRRSCDPLCARTSRQPDGIHKRLRLGSRAKPSPSSGLLQILRPFAPRLQTRPTPPSATLRIKVRFIPIPAPTGTVTGRQTPCPPNASIQPPNPPGPIRRHPHRFSPSRPQYSV